MAAIRGTPAGSWERASSTHGVPIYTDARLYSSAGIPTVLYGAGPRTLLEANGHRADERLVLEDCIARRRWLRSRSPTCWRRKR